MDVTYGFVVLMKILVRIFLYLWFKWYWIPFGFSAALHFFVQVFSFMVPEPFKWYLILLAFPLALLFFSPSCLMVPEQVAFSMEFCFFRQVLFQFLISIFHCFFCSFYLSGPEFFSFLLIFCPRWLSFCLSVEQFFPHLFFPCRSWQRDFFKFRWIGLVLIFFLNFLHHFGFYGAVYCSFFFSSSDFSYAFFVVVVSLYWSVSVFSDDIFSFLFISLVL